MGPEVLALPHRPALSTRKRGVARDIGREVPLPSVTRQSRDMMIIPPK